MQKNCKLFKKGATIFGICNVVGSSIARITDAGAYTHAGPEIGVASTKAFTAQVTIFNLIGILLAQKNSGNSAIIATQAVRDIGCEVDTVVTLLDRQEGARKSLSKEGIELQAIFEAEDFNLIS